MTIHGRTKIWSVVALLSVHGVAWAATDTAAPIDEPGENITKERQAPDAQHAGLPGNLHLEGWLKQETAYRLDTPRVFTKIKQQGLLTETGSLTDALSFKATQRMWYDAIYDVSDHFPKTAERGGQEFDAELRETYLDYSQGNFDVRVGKQQIVWGDAVGLFFADVVNAKDLREYVLPDFDLIRIPQWGVDLEFTQDPVHAEFVWLPVLQFNRLGTSGSEFEFPYPVPPGVAFTTTDPSKPPSAFDNSEIGGRLSYLIDGWDVSGFYFHTWDKFPVPYRRIASGVYHFDPAYQRADLWGMSFSKDLQAVVLKGELVYNPRQSLVTFDSTDPDGIVEKNALDYLVGVDHTFFDRLETNVQLMERWIPNHRDQMQDDPLTTHVSFWAKTNFLDGKLQPECLLITSVAETDLLLRPKVTYNVTDSLGFAFGADMFQGHDSGLFGRFDGKSRVYTEVTYRF